MSGYWSRLHDPLALVAALVAPFLVALALVPFRTGLSATNEALIMVVVVVAVAALGTRAAERAGRRFGGGLVRLLPDQALPAVHHRAR